MLADAVPCEPPDLVKRNSLCPGASLSMYSRTGRVAVYLALVSAPEPLVPCRVRLNWRKMSLSFA